MPYKRQWKAHVIDYEAWSDLPDEPNTITCLTPKDVSILVAGLQSFRWYTRWLNDDGTLQLPELIDQLEYKLLNQCCDGIAECIENSTAVQNALKAYFTGQKYGGASQDLAENISALDTCDDDVVFGAVTELVKYINRLVEDTFERIEVATNVAENLADWLDGTVAASPLSSIIDYVDWLIESVADEYAAEYDTALEDEYRCDLFCLMKDNNCEITNRQLFDYFADRLTSSVDETSLTDYLDFFVNGSFPGSQIVDALYASVIGMFVVDQAVEQELGWFDLTSSYGLQTSLALGASKPDSGHTLLCDPCVNTWCVAFAGGNGQLANDASLQLASANFTGLPTYDSANKRYEGSKTAISLPDSASGRFRFNMSAGQSITRITAQIDWLSTRTSGGTTQNMYVIVYDDTNTQLAISAFSGLNTATSTSVDITLSSAYSGSYLDVRFGSANNNNTDAAYIYVNSFSIYGEGADPDYGGTTC
jgi:hypothetical protein